MTPPERTRDAVYDALRVTDWTGDMDRMYDTFISALTKSGYYVHAATPEPPDLSAALWQCGVESGMDTDGDAGPGAMIAGMGYAGFAAAMVEYVRQLRRDYDECLLAQQPETGEPR